jgi:hypothetical protein
MAQKFVSPGVFTSELDESFLAQGVGAIGAAVIGATLKGPAFTPTIVHNYQEFVYNFGGLTTGSQLPYAAKNYLKNGGTLTVVRVLGDSNGTGASNGSPTMNAYKIYAFSGSSQVSMGILFSSGSASLSTSAGNVVLSGAFTPISATNTYGAGNFWTKLFNADPTQYSSKGHFVYMIDGWNLGGGYNSYALSMSFLATASFNADWSTAATNIVTSQYYQGVGTYPLFRFYTRAAGAAANNSIKVTVQNVKPTVNASATLYGTFDVVVRSYGDTDQRPQLLEAFTQCTMDPSSQYYVARVIGDQYEYWDSVKMKNIVTGSFANRSKYIRMSMVSPVVAPAGAVPFGFQGYTVITGTLTGITGAALPYIQNQTNAQGNLDPSVCWGVDFSQLNVNQALQYFPTSLVQSSPAAFNLGYIVSGTYQGQTTWSYSANISSSYWLPLAISSSVQKFTLPFNDGFDGVDITDLTPYDFTSDSDTTSAQTVWFKKGVAVVSNPDQWDFNVMAIPGVTNFAVNDYGRQVCNNRADAFYVMDIPGASVTDAVSKLINRSPDDNYASVYYSDLIYNDVENNRLVQVKPSVAVLGALSYNDRVGQPFFAPAGLNRGGLGQFDIVDVVDRLTYDERSMLYDNRINPIASFPVEGIVIWGQKTLQARPSALDRVNIRRLLIYAKKLIASEAKYLLFEPNNPNTWQRFLNAVNPILAKIKQDQGLDRFKVVMDSTVNTPDLVDRNIMTGKIFLQPTRTAEFIDLQFIITSSGVSFGD